MAWEEGRKRRERCRGHPGMSQIRGPENAQQIMTVLGHGLIQGTGRSPVSTEIKTDR